MFFDLFKSEKIVNKSVDLVDDSIRGIGNWIDEQQFTDQEKIEAKQKFLTFRLTVLEKTSDESSVRSISRRILAWAISGTFLFLLIFGCIVYKIDKDWSLFILECLRSLSPAFIAVNSFYFVGQIGNSWIDKTKEKLGK